MRQRRQSLNKTAAPSYAAPARACLKQKPGNLKKNQNKEKCVCPAPPPLVHTPRPLTPTARCQKLSYKFLFVSIFQRDGEELGLYTRARRRVYPAAPAPGTRESPHCCRWKQERARSLRGWQEEVEGGGRSTGGAAERSSLSDSNLGTCTFYNFPAFRKTCEVWG